MKRCSVEGCTKGGRTRRGWCQLHYDRWRRQGDPLVLERVPKGTPFLSKMELYVEKRGCWLWTGATDQDGYGFVKIDGTQQRAHRASYESFVGPIPEGHEVDHLCHVRNCVNPAHLEAVSGAENRRRANARRYSGEDTP